MFDDVTTFLDDHPSVVEGALRRLLEESGRRPVIVLDVESHGRGREAESPRPTEPAPTAEPETAPIAPAPVAEFRRLLETGARHLTAAVAAQREEARQAAVRARELAAFARQRPAELFDRPEEEIGAAAAASRAARPEVLTRVSEWAVDEVSAALHLPAQTAAQVLAEAVILVERLPGTLVALESGLIGPAHARMLAEVLAPLGDDIRAQVERDLLAKAAGKTVAQLRVAAKRAVLRADAKAAERRMATAIRDRTVAVYPGEDGMGTLATTLPIPVVLACRRVLERQAERCAVPGDGRTKDQRMADCLADLILRPGINPPVQVQLTVVAPVSTLTGGDEPGEIDGHPVPAVAVRELAYGLGLLPRPEGAPVSVPFDPTAPPAPPAAFVVSANAQAAADLANLLGLPRVAGTALAQLPAIAVVDELSGQLLALSDAGEIRRAAACHRRSCRTGRRPCSHPPRGPGLGPPPATPRYTPSDRLARFVRARDRRCRFPGCRARAIVCDLDHNQPWPQGTTSAANLCCLCRHHHRLRHQAPGWSMRRLPDGGLRWTLPGGERRTTYPLRYGTDDHPEPPQRRPPDAAVAPPLTAREGVVGRRLPAGAVDRDPPPF